MGPSSGEGKRRSCSPGCLPPESCVSIGECRGGELFTVTLGGGPGMKPQMNSSCSRRSRLKQTAPRAGRALQKGPELLEPRLEREGCGASPRSRHAQVPCARGVPAWGQWPRLLPRGWAGLPAPLPPAAPRPSPPRHSACQALGFQALENRPEFCGFKPILAGCEAVSRGFAQAGTPVPPWGASGHSVLPWYLFFFHPTFPLSHLLNKLKASAAEQGPAWRGAAPTCGAGGPWREEGSAQPRPAAALPGSAAFWPWGCSTAFFLARGER